MRSLQNVLFWSLVVFVSVCIIQGMIYGPFRHKPAKFYMQTPQYQKPIRELHPRIKSKHLPRRNKWVNAKPGTVETFSTTKSTRRTHSELDAEH